MYRYEKEIIAACESVNFEKLCEYIAKGANPNARDEHGSTPLILAVSLGHQEAVKMLLNAGADPLHCNDEGWDALAVAYENDDNQIVKILAIACAQSYKFIEVEIGDSENILVNKLITTLLYESSRHAWEMHPCSTIRIYIGYLDSQYKEYTKTHFSSEIKRIETEANTFYGSYLSDDSDSEEESTFSRLEDKDKNSYRIYAEELREHAQVSKICYRKKSGNNQKGDLKLSKIEASQLFDFSARIQIRYPELSRNAKLRLQVEMDLQKLNEKFEEHKGDAEKFNQSIAGLKTKFLIAQYRGITYLTTRWNKPARVAHRAQNEVSKPVYSSAVYKQMNIHSLCQLPEKETTVENFDKIAAQIADLVKEILLSLRVERGCSYKGYAFNNLAELLQQAYSSDYDGFHRLLQTDNTLRNLLVNYVNPFISTGDIPYHAAKYAFGIKPYKGHEHERLRPRWQANGKAERPYSGKIYLSLHPISDYVEDGPLHVISLVWQGRMMLDNLTIPERESAFPGFIKANRVVAHYKAKYPSFKGHYKAIFLHKYGIDKTLYEKFKEALQASVPHSETHSNFKKLLGEWLCSYYEAKLISEARDIASEKGAILVYRNEQGLFSLNPPIDSPTRNGVLAAQKTPVKEMRALRKKISSPDRENIDRVDIPYSLSEKCLLYNDDIYHTEEDIQGGPDLIQAILLNAVKCNYARALKHYLSRPALIAICNEGINDVWRLENATLLHVTVGLGYVELIEVFAAVTGTGIDFNIAADETTYSNWHGDYFYLENLTPLLFAIVLNHEQVIIKLINLPFVNKRALANGVYNKDKIEDAFEKTDAPDKDTGHIGFFLIKPDCFPITRIKNLSALHLAVMFANVAVLKILIASGIDPTIKNTEGETAYDLAIELGKKEHATLLRQENFSDEVKGIKEKAEQPRLENNTIAIENTAEIVKTKFAQENVTAATSLLQFSSLFANLTITNQSQDNFRHSSSFSRSQPSLSPALKQKAHTAVHIPQEYEEYRGEQIHAALLEVIQGSPNIKIFLTQMTSRQFIDLLNSDAQQFILLKQPETLTIAILQIHTNHWIALLFDNRQTENVILSIDPTGHNMDKNLLETISDKFNGIKIDYSKFNFQITGIEFDGEYLTGDTTNCGPWVIKLVELYIINNRLPQNNDLGNETFNINAERLRQKLWINNHLKEVIDLERIFSGETKDEGTTELSFVDTILPELLSSKEAISKGKAFESVGEAIVDGQQISVAKLASKYGLSYNSSVVHRIQRLFLSENASRWLKEGYHDDENNIMSVRCENETELYVSLVGESYSQQVKAEVLFDLGGYITEAIGKENYMNFLVNNDELHITFSNAAVAKAIINKLENEGFTIQPHEKYMSVKTGRNI